MTTTAAAAPTAADHAAYGSVTWLCALESATENWADHNGHQPETDAELAEVDAWALGYIDSGLSEVYEGDHLDLIAGTATPQTHATEEPAMTAATAPRGTKTVKITTARLVPGTVVLATELGTVAHTKTGALLREVASTERVAPGAYERNSRIVVHFADGGTSAVSYSSSQTWMTPAEPVAATPETPAAEPVSTDTHATQEDTMTDTAEYRVTRNSDGSYRVIDPAGQLVSNHGRSKAKAQAKADRLNAEEPWGTPAVPPMRECADDTCCGEADPFVAADAAVAQETAELAADPAFHATVDAALAADADAAQRQTATEDTRPFTIGGRLAAAVDGDLATELDSVSAKLAARKPTKDGTRRIHITIAEAVALDRAAKVLEGKARELVASGDRAAVSLVFSCTQAQANLAKLFAGPEAKTSAAAAPRREVTASINTPKVRLGRRFVEFLTGTQAAFDPSQPDHELVRRVLDAPTRKDGSASVELTDEERANLLDYAEGMVTAAADDAGPGDTDALADLNAARAAVRALA